MKFFTSDLHFNHKNICRGVSNWDSGHRDFDSLPEMNGVILNSINSRVRKHDELYILGDFAMGQKHLHPGFREKIDCHNIHLIRGNHDSSMVKDCGFSSIKDYDEVRIHADDGRSNTVVCFHYYIGGVWNNVGRGWFHLFGHSHGSLNPTIVQGKALDVGWDCHRQPLSENEIFELMDKRPERDSGLDHHSSDPQSWSF